MCNLHLHISSLTLYSFVFSDSIPYLAEYLFNICLLNLVGLPDGTADCD